jgi:hypothetical protein
MIRFLKNDQIDSEKWNECITESSNGNIYGYTWYLDVVCPDWCALVEEDYSFVMPLPSWKKMGINYLAQPLFTQQLGIYATDSISSRDVKEFLYKIPARFKYGDFNLNSYNRIETSGFNYKYNINYELELGLPFEQLENSFSENLRRNIRKAGRFSLKVSKTEDPALLIKLFRQNRGARLTALSDEQYDLLLKLLKMLLQKGLCDVWGVYDELGALIGGVSWVKSNQSVVFLFSAVSETGRSKGAMPFLIDQFIRENAGKQLVLDFEGSNDENLGRFYSSFGARKVFYPRVYFNYLPFTIRLGIRVFRYLRTLLKK